MSATPALGAALVTGGGGFLGGAVVDALLARGARVGSISRGAYPGLEAKGARTYQADLGDPATGPAALAAALEELRDTELSAADVARARRLAKAWR